MTAIALIGQTVTTVKLNLRQGAPNRQAAVLRKLDAGTTLQVQALATGESVQGNAHWYLTDQQGYVWAGGCGPLQTSAPAPVTAAGQTSGDGAFIAKLIQTGSSPDGLAEAQKMAAKALADAGQPAFPHNACAATLSALLQLAGINVPMTLGAGKLANRLGGASGSRGWSRVEVGAQRAGDVGVTYDEGGNPGADHIYLVLQAIDADQMLIADNQDPAPHTRFASGHGKTPTEYFLRAC